MAKKPVGMGVSQCPVAAITKCHNQRGLDNRNLLSHILVAGSLR